MKTPVVELIEAPAGTVPAGAVAVSEYVSVSPGSVATAVNVSNEPTVAVCGAIGASVGAILALTVKLTAVALPVLSAASVDEAVMVYVPFASTSVFGIVTDHTPAAGVAV